MANQTTLPVSVRASVTSNLGAQAANAVTKNAFTVPGARVGHHVIVKAESLDTNLGLVGAYVSAANTVQVLIVNPTASPIDPISQTYDFLVL